MTKKETTKSKSRQRYSDEYKVEALALAQRIGVSAAVRQLSARVTTLQLAQDRGEHGHSFSQYQNGVIHPGGAGKSHCMVNN
ncbi:hypothetical protein KP814_31445 [Hahella sp. HN01]|nr:hypothetical protein [Hahella sp. HN01]